MEWINVKDKLPAVYTAVLLWGIAIGDDLCESCQGRQLDTDSLLNIYLGFLNEEEDVSFNCDFELCLIKVSHWMPLPEPPKE